MREDIREIEIRLKSRIPGLVVVTYDEIRDNLHIAVYNTVAEWNTAIRITPEELAEQYGKDVIMILATNRYVIETGDDRVQPGI